uniref:Uncharacterized protein n=1 Tax=Panagrolaimus sp. PS1159 TaxID=55785 RepID=A0AC35FWC9_9BILA
MVLRVLVYLIDVTDACVGHSEFKKLSFFILTWQLLICDFIALGNKFILAVPTSLVGYQMQSVYWIILWNAFIRFFTYTQ